MMKRWSFRNLFFLIFFISLIVFLSYPILISRSILFAQPQEAKLTFIIGEVYVKRIGSRYHEKATVGMSLNVEDEIKTYEGSRAEITLPNRSVVRIDEKTELKISSLISTEEKDSTGIKLPFGNLWAKIKKLTKADWDFKVETRNAVAGIRGTTYRIEAKEDLTRVKVYDGKVTVKGIPPTAPPGVGVRGKGQVVRRIKKPVREVPKPYHEVGREEYIRILERMMTVTVGRDGRVSDPVRFDEKKDALSDWVRWNKERDKKLSF